jgi:HTH-type transcriptional regulator/antitoxin HigA
MTSIQSLSPIRTDSDYQDALALASRYTDMDPEPESAEGAHFDALVTLIEAWERKHYPLPPPDPVEAIRFRMDQAGLSAADLKPYIGGLNRVYEVLNRKRRLSLAMIRKLHRGLGVPLESLIGGEELLREARHRTGTRTRTDG